VVRGNVFQIVFVHVGVHPRPVCMELLVVGGTGQRRQNEEFEQFISIVYPRGRRVYRVMCAIKTYP
jgi:hypothetical protein